MKLIKLLELKVLFNVKISESCHILENTLNRERQQEEFYKTQGPFYVVYYRNLQKYWGSIGITRNLRVTKAILGPPLASSLSSKM